MWRFVVNRVLYRAWFRTREGDSFGGNPDTSVSNQTAMFRPRSVCVKLAANLEEESIGELNYVGTNVNVNI
jgi:hypothetical protein